MLKLFLIYAAAVTGCSLLTLLWGLRTAAEATDDALHDGLNEFTDPWRPKAIHLNADDGDI